VGCGFVLKAAHIKTLDNREIPIKPDRFNRDVMFSSKSEEWATPDHVFKALDEEFRFTLDPCATPENAKCDKFFTKADNGLIQDWGGERVFMNPPYGAKVGRWVRKAVNESLKPGTVVVCLLYSKTGTRWFHNYCSPHGMIWFIKGRLTFGGAEHPAPYDSMIVIFPKDWKDRL